MLEPKFLNKFAKFCQILILTLCDLWLYPVSWQKLPNYRVFSGKGKGDGALILIYLDRLMAEVFPHHFISFSISVIFRVKQEVKVRPKVQTLSPSSFHGNSNPSIFLQTTLLLARVLPLMRISAILDYILGSHPKKAISWMLNRHENFESV